MNDNPKIRWHANGEGKCHGECEQKNKPNNSQSGCGVVDRLPWYTKLEAVPIGAPCPFAVLGDVLCLHERPQVVPEWMCREIDKIQCIDCSWRKQRGCIPPLSGGPCTDRRPTDDRRCGTCANSGCKWSPRLPGEDGPPWPNCRFWRPRT